MAFRDGDNALYLASKSGAVWAFRDGEGDPEPVLDLRGRVSTGTEQGLLGLAFSPDGAFVYVNFTDLDGNTNVLEYAWRGGRAAPATERRVLFVPQPYANHNGGNLVFGPDGYLYIGLGDGGSQGDPSGNGQNLGVLLAKMLRIAPRMPDGSLPPGGRPYAIPPDNPFVDEPGARPEVWAYGLRNPWRYSFDRRTGDLWIGDVGWSSFEEVDLQRADAGGGQNYGWALMEGNDPMTADPPADAVPPIYQYPTRDGACAITGGYVYRGGAIPNLQGWYVFADFCRGNVTALRVIGGEVLVEPLVTVDQVASLGEDQDGELYVLSLAGRVFELVP